MRFKTQLAIKSGIFIFSGLPDPNTPKWIPISYMEERQRERNNWSRWRIDRLPSLDATGLSPFILIQFNHLACTMSNIKFLPCVFLFLFSLEHSPDSNTPTLLPCPPPPIPSMQIPYSFSIHLQSLNKSLNLLLNSSTHTHPFHAGHHRNAWAEQHQFDFSDLFRSRLPQVRDEAAGSGGGGGVVSSFTLEMCFVK